MSAPLEVRPDLVDSEPYVSPQQPARYRMNTNESPFAPPEDILRAYSSELARAEMNRYPDRDATRLLDALAAHTGLGRERIWAANGSNELFLQLMLAFGGPARTALMFEPSYSVHRLVARISGTRVATAPRDASFDVALDAARELIAESRPELIVVCSPNNPTGNLVSAAQMESLLAIAPGLVVVDEAYIEFAPEGSSSAPLLAANPGLVVTRTFSKAWNLAGVRLGYLLAHPGVVDGLRKVGLPYHLSGPAQSLGVLVLERASHARATIATIVAQRAALEEGLDELGVEVFPSAANFVLFRVGSAADVWAALLERGVLVRDHSNTEGLRGCLRVTAGSPEETEAFLSALREALEGR